jgi:hypothetical protein
MLTKELIQNYYEDGLESIKVIQMEKPEYIGQTDWDFLINGNKQYIKKLLEQKFWTDEDLNPFKSVNLD